MYEPECHANVNVMPSLEDGSAEQNLRQWHTEIEECLLGKTNEKRCLTLLSTDATRGSTIFASAHMRVRV